MSRWLNRTTPLASVLWTLAGCLWLSSACGPEEVVVDDGPGSPGGSSSSRPDAGSSGDAATPPSAPALRQLASLGNHSCALWEDGAVKCWGANQFGQLGYGDTETRGDQPGEMGDALPLVPLGSSQRAVRIATGLLFSCALLESGHIKCWGGGIDICGANSDEDCGIGYGDAEARGDQPGEMGDALPVLDLGRGAKAIDLDCGALSCCALLDSQRIKCWGDNAFGVLGYGDQMTRGARPGEMGDALPAIDLGVSGVRQVRLGRSLVGQHACAVLDTGELKCWGGNFDGQLGLLDVETRGDEQDEMGTALPVVPTGERVQSVALGEQHTCAVLDTGRIRCWGRNSQGQLGLGDTQNRGDAPERPLPIVDLDTRRAVRQISASGHSCALLDDGRIKCWGRNHFPDSPELSVLGYGDTLTRGTAAGQMGDALPSVDLGASGEATSVITGMTHTCVQFANHKLKCWGANSFGALGYGDLQPRGGRPGEMGDALPFLELGR